MNDWTPSIGENVLVTSEKSPTYAGQVRVINTDEGWATVRVTGTTKYRRARLARLERHPLSTQRNVPEES